MTPLLRAVAPSKPLCVSVCVCIITHICMYIDICTYMIVPLPYTIVFVYTVPRTGCGWHSSFYIYTCTHTQTLTETRNLSCIGKDWCCHAQGDLTYRCRGDTNQREKPYCVCACVRVCVRVCVFVIVTEAWAERREREIGGGPAGIHILPGLFKVYALLIY